MSIKEELYSVLGNYKHKAIKRKNNFELPPRPLSKKEVEVIFKALTVRGLNDEEFEIFSVEKVDELLIRLISNEVRRGTFPSSYSKAEGLANLLRGELKSDYLDAEKALELLADMKGGAASGELIDLLEEGIFPERTVSILKETVLINEAEFARLIELIDKRPEALDIVKSWAKREFAEEWSLEEEYQGVVIKVGDNITTGHISPSKNADSRTDHPRHAQYIMDGREDEADFMERLEKLRQKNDNVILAAGEALGEGSSRKSATYTMLQVLGKACQGEPEKKKGGLVIAKSMAPIFKKSLIASGILPVICNTTEVNEGDIVKVDFPSEKLNVNNFEEIIDIELPLEYELNKISAGGMTFFDAGNELEKWAKKYCEENNIDFNTDEIKDLKSLESVYEQKTTRQHKKSSARIPQTLAQKIVGMNRLDGKDTIYPGETAEIRIRGVFSQDTTGPMTIEEYQSMAGGDFGSDFVVQSLCHTGECPSSEDRERHSYIDEFITGRGGVCLKPGEGIIHTIGNRFVLPTDVIVGGDSHTRTPRGLSFPASSDIVAGAMKYGKQDLTMDESVRVIFYGKPREGITARDLVSTLVVFAENSLGKGVYNGRIIEMEGIDYLDSDQRYILTNAVAERSASAGTIPPDEKTIEAVKENLKYLKNRWDADKSPSVKDTIKAFEEFLKDSVLPEADSDAEYAATVEIPLDEVWEPLVAKPHHPDNVAPLSEVEGIKLDEIFIGSCVGGNIESIRAAARIVDGYHVPHEINFVVSPASIDIYQKLAEDGSLAKLTSAGATVIMPGCGLCMGNKRRIGPDSTALTTTTRNYQSRIGPASSRTYLGSAHIAACAAVLGRFPTVEEYFEMFK